MTNKISNFETFAFVAPVCLMLLIGFVAPLGFIVFNSVTIDGAFTLKGYSELISGPLFFRVLRNTLEIALIASITALLVGYPVALHISRQRESLRPLYLLFVLLPFWTSILVKSFAFTVILGDQGIVNSFFAQVGLPRFEMIFNRFGVLVGTTNYLIPFAVLPILANLLSQDANLRKAAEVMGSGPIRIFWKITFPLSRSGLSAAFVTTFIMSLGFFATPALLGGRQDMMLSNLVDFYTRVILNWNAASVVAVLLFVTSAVFLFLFSRVSVSEHSV